MLQLAQAEGSSDAAQSRGRNPRRALGPSPVSCRKPIPAAASGLAPGALTRY